MKLDWKSAIWMLFVIAPLLLFAALFIPGVPGKEILGLILFGLFALQFALWIVIGIPMGIYQQIRDRKAVAAFRSRDVAADPPITQSLRYPGSLPLSWSRNESAWGIPEFLLYEGPSLVAAYWLEPDGCFLEAETSEGRWIGTVDGSCLRVSLPTPNSGTVILNCGQGYTLECPDKRLFRIKCGGVISMCVPFFPVRSQSGKAVRRGRSGEPDHPLRLRSAQLLHRTGCGRAA